MDLFAALLQIIILATLVQFVTDIVKGWLPAAVLKYLTPQILSAIIGIGIALLLGIDLFTLSGYAVGNTIISQVITGIILSAGSTAIHELIAKLRESRGTNGAAGESTEGVPIRKKLMPQANYYMKSPHGAIAPNFITIHNTANDATAASEINYMSRIDTGSNVSFHYAVDDLEVVQGLPEFRSAIHAGTTAGNKSSIAIEICHSKSGGARFLQAERNAAWLAAKILHERGWGIDHVRTHQSWSGKYCPARTLDMGWQRFMNMISAELVKYDSAPAVTPVPSPTDPETVLITGVGNSSSDGKGKSTSAGIGKTGKIIKILAGAKCPYGINYTSNTWIDAWFPAASIKLTEDEPVLFAFINTIEEMNIRSAPKMGDNIVEKAPLNSRLGIVEMSGSWGRIENSNPARWINVAPRWGRRE